jgi:nitrite reductase/ring-hydroxylating ferredoxin subunit
MNPTEIPHVPQKHLVRGLHGRRNQRQAAGPHHLQPGHRVLPPKAGEVAAVEDFCPHRGAPLSLGFVCDGKLVCGYHGLEMGCDGKTVAMPGQRVGGFPAIRSFPVEERYGFVWVWPGDKDKADPALIPHLAWHDHPEWAYGGGLLPRQGRLPADGRQPDGPDARDLCALHQHRPEGNRRNAVQDHGQRRRGGDQPLHARHPRAAVLESRAARQGPGRRRAGGPLADLPLHAAQPRDDRSGRGPRRPRRLRRPARTQGVQRGGRLHHARDRHLHALLLGHGAQVQPGRRRADRADPRRPGQDLLGRPGDAGAPAEATSAPSPSAPCSSSTSTPAACSRAR